MFEDLFEDGPMAALVFTLVAIQQLSQHADVAQRLLGEQVRERALQRGQLPHNQAVVVAHPLLAAVLRGHLHRQHLQPQLAPPRAGAGEGDAHCALVADRVDDRG